jgi:tRNA 2-thiouridine synthesizing protein A
MRARVLRIEMASPPASLEMPVADRVVDARGMACPGPLLEAKRGILLVPVGGVLEVISSDEETTIDVPAWAWKVGHTYLGAVRAAGAWRVFVRRNR